MTLTVPEFPFHGGGEWRRRLKRLEQVAERSLPRLPEIDRTAIAAALGKPAATARDLVRRHHELVVEARLGSFRAAFAAAASTAAVALEAFKTEEEKLRRELNGTDRARQVVREGEPWTGLDFFKAALFLAIVFTLLAASYLQLTAILGSNPNLTETGVKAVSALTLAAPFAFKGFVDSRERDSTKRLLMTVAYVLAFISVIYWVLNLNATFGATFTAPKTSGTDAVMGALLGSEGPAEPAAPPASSQSFVACSLIAEILVSIVCWNAFQRIAERHETLISQRNPKHRRLSAETGLEAERSSQCASVLAVLDARVKEVDDLSTAFIDSSLQRLEIARELRGAQLGLLSEDELTEPIEPDDVTPDDLNSTPNESDEENHDTLGRLDRFGRNGFHSDDDLRDRLAEHDDRDDID